MTPAYIELHVRSAFSFLRGASTPEALAGAAAKLELPAMALCDHDGVYGAPRFFQAARQLGVQAIVGAEITLEDGSALPLLVKSEVGYQNLCRLITETKLKPRALEVTTPQDDQVDPRERKRPCYATWSELEQFSGDLVALTGDEEGPVLRAWQSGGAPAAGAALEKIARVFGRENCHVEMQCHLARGDEQRMRLLADLAAAHPTLHAGLLATGGVTHATHAEREVADAFTCLRHHTTLDAAGRLLAPNAERHLRHARAMQALFREFPEAVTNTVRLKERLTFTLQQLPYKFPDFPVPANHSQASFLRERVFEGARDRYANDGGITPAIHAQIEKELALITRLGFCGYFLVVWDICRWCRDHNTLVQGRGSAANSVVCYALGVTAIEPIKNRLLFERFLSDGRIGKDGHPSWPDVDLDLPSGDLREGAIQELYRRYAPLGAAMTANVITYRGRSAAREIGKVLGLPEDVLDAYSSLYANGDFPQTIEMEQQMKMAGLPAQHPRLPAFTRLYRMVRGLPRHLGQHSGGMVICAGALDRVVPLEPATMPGRVVVQWDKDDCEELGIVKIDLLGLGMMKVLQDTFEMCNARGDPLRLHTVPQDDPKTYAMMQEADTIGVFQIESRAQMSTLRRFKPANFYDVAMQVSIVRPGPIVGKVCAPLLQRRTMKPGDFSCLDPSVDEIMRPVLERTYGVVLFQEQMLQIAMLLAGFNAGEAEELRRAMGFTKSTERLARVLQKLRDSMHTRGHSETVIEKVVDAAKTFGLYGFPEAHAMSFALLAYASTWLKAHRPAEFIASLLNNQPMGFYGPATLVQDARRHGVQFRPVCVVASDWICAVEAQTTVRIGLNYVKGLRETAARAMLATRAQRPFASLEDFLARTIFTPAERRALASIGALNVFAGHRRAALWQVEAGWAADEELLRRFASGEVVSSPDAGPGLWPMPSFACDENETATASGPALQVAEDRAHHDVGFSPLAPMSLAERYAADFRGTSLTTGTHPMALMRESLPDVWRAGDLPLARGGERVKIAGSVICRQRPGTAKGVVFVSLEDETGVANAIVAASLFERNRLIITQAHALAITGRLQNQGGVIHIKAERFEPLSEAAVPAGASHDFH